MSDSQKDFDKKILTENQAFLDVKQLVRYLIKYKASDLHLKVGRPPLFRIQGKLFPSKMSNLTQEAMESMVFRILTIQQKLELEKNKQIDFSFQAEDLGRFRCQAYYQRGTLALAIRLIPSQAPRLDSLGTPTVLKELCQRSQGLILITGPTGSGKSTTLAGAIQHINETQAVHILALEDPIEFVYHDAQSSISQREIGSDVHSMQEALIAGLRQDPDIIVLGELRDIHTIQVALTAAETGHLVLSTLHTADAKSTIDRILDVFGHEAQRQIRFQLATNLMGVFCQQLIPRKDGNGVVLACETMIKSPAIENYIRKDQLDQIPEAIASSTDYYQMQSMNQSLEKLILSELITLEDGLKSSRAPDDLKLRLSGLNRQEGFAR